MTGNHQSMHWLAVYNKLHWLQYSTESSVKTSNPRYDGIFKYNDKTDTACRTKWQMQTHKQINKQTNMRVGRTFSEWWQSRFISQSYCTHNAVWSAHGKWHIAPLVAQCAVNKRCKQSIIVVWSAYSVTALLLSSFTTFHRLNSMQHFSRQKDKLF